MKINKKKLDQLSISDLESLIFMAEESIEQHKEEGGVDNEKCKNWKHLKKSCESAMTGRINSLYLDDKGINSNPDFFFI